MQKCVRAWDDNRYYRVDSLTTGRTQRQLVNAGWLALRRDEEPPPAAAHALVWPGAEERFETSPYSDEELIEMIYEEGRFPGWWLLPDFGVGP